MLGVAVDAGIVKEGTPICVPSKEVGGISFCTTTNSARAALPPVPASLRVARLFL